MVVSPRKLLFLALIGLTHLGARHAFGTDARYDYSVSHGDLRSTATTSSTREAPAEPANVLQASTQKTNVSDEEYVRKIINAGTSRIVKSLGCVVGAGDPKILEEAVKNWSEQIHDLGPNPKMITKKTSYPTYLRAVAWDYLNGSDACGSIRTECYRRLYKPIENLFAFIRTYDQRDKNVIKAREKLVDDLNDIVKTLRADGSKIPPCMIDKEKAKEKSPERFYTGQKPSTRDDDHSSSSSSSAASTNFTGTDLQKFEQALVASGANPNGVKKALEYFANNRGKFANQKYISFIDYTKNAMTSRYFLLDTSTLQVKRYHVAHGVNSGSYGGTPSRFSNEHGSRKSSVGAFRIAEADNYNPRLKYSKVTWVDGLEPGKNDQVRARGAYMHPAWYVGTGGRSHGCPALTSAGFAEVQPKVKGGSFLYVYAN